MILHVPHASRIIPREVRTTLLLNDKELEDELDEMTDTNTDSLARQASGLSEVRPWIFNNLLSRLVVDPERFPDNREIMNQIGMGVVYHRTSQGLKLREIDEGRDNSLIEEYFEPYSKSLETLVQSLITTMGSVTIVDVHSYRINEHPNGVNRGLRRPDICLGTDAFHTPEWLDGAAYRAFETAGLVIRNEPYAGTYIPLAFYEKNSDVTSVMMENREDNLIGLRFDKSVQALVRLINEIQARGNATNN